MKRDFRSLSAQEALQVAIFIEERNADIYHQMGEMFAEFHDAESLEVARAFWETAAEERDHENRLQKRYFERYGAELCPITEDDLRELIEVPKLDVGNLFALLKSIDGRPPRELAFEVADQAERQAIHFYRALAETTADARMRAVYREFAELETAHGDWVKKKLAEAGTTRQRSGTSAD